LKEWDREIERLRIWSPVFEQSVESSPSEVEINRLYSIFEQLAKIGGAFGMWPNIKRNFNGYLQMYPIAHAEARAMAKTSSAPEEAVEERLKRAAYAISNSSGKSIDVKLDTVQKMLKRSASGFRGSK
jgi:hypothetical protein